MPEPSAAETDQSNTGVHEKEGADNGLINETEPEGSALAEEIQSDLDNNTPPDTIFRKILGFRIRRPSENVQAQANIEKNQQDSSNPKLVESNEVTDDHSSRTSIEEPPEIASSPEKEILTEAKQTLEELTTFLTEWRTVEQADTYIAEDSLVDSFEKFVQLKSRLRDIKTFRHLHVTGWNDGLDSITQKTKEELKDKRELLEASGLIKVLEQAIIKQAVQETGVEDPEELAQVKWLSFTDNLENPTDAQKKIVFGVLSPYIVNKFGESDERFGIGNFDNIRTVWRDKTIIASNRDIYTILQEIVRKSDEAGEEDLANFARAELKSNIGSYVRGLPSVMENVRQEIDDYDAVLNQIGRYELAVSIFNLAKNIDNEEGGSSNLDNAAKELGVDPDELGFIASYFARNEMTFYNKLALGTLEVPLDQQPEYVRKALAQQFEKIQADSLVHAFPENSNSMIANMVDALKRDPIIFDIAGNRIKEYDAISQSEYFTQAIKDGNFNIQKLLQKISHLDDPRAAIQRFENIFKAGDEAAIIWEYFRLNGDDESTRFFQMTAKENLPSLGTDVPGLPKNLQWRSMRQSDKERFSIDRSFDDEDRIRVDYLTPEGRSILLKSIIKGVVERSRSEEYKRIAEGRNRQASEMGNAKLEPGDLLHGTNIKYLDAILHGGDRAGEFLGFDQASDATPIGADFSVVLPTDASGEFVYEQQVPFDAEKLREEFKNNPFYATYGASIAIQYGARGESSFTSQDAESTATTGITIMFGRNREDTFLKGTEYKGHMREHHVLVPVGLPSTEITGIIVNNDATSTIEQAKQSIIEHGFYIPIYGIRGELLFTYQDYLITAGKEVKQEESEKAPESLVVDAKK